MALYSLNVNIKSRANGANAIAAAAYRSGAKLKDYQTGETKYYKSKEREVVYHNIILPDGAPVDFKDQETLWNSVEQNTKRKDGQVAREYRVALQNEFTTEENIDCLNQLAVKLAADGQVVDISYHAKNGNPHAHILCPVMSIGPDGQWQPKRITVFKMAKNPITGTEERIPVIDSKTGKQKTRKGKKVWVREEIMTPSGMWSKKDYLQEIRRVWEDIVNKKFMKKGLNLQISHKSYKDREIDKMPTVHLGPSAAAMKRRGLDTTRGQQNQLILTINTMADETKKVQEEIDKTENEKEKIKAEQAKLQGTLDHLQEALKNYENKKAEMKKWKKKVRDLDFTPVEINSLTRLSSEDFNYIVQSHNKYMYMPNYKDKLDIADAILARQEKGYIRVPANKTKRRTPKKSKGKNINHGHGREMQR